MRCEEFVNEYLPTVKAEIVDVLYDEYDFTQVEISYILDITQPAVSQYLSGERGGSKELDEEVLKQIKKSAEELSRLHGSDEMTEEKLDEIMCDLCKKI